MSRARLLLAAALLTSCAAAPPPPPQPTPAPTLTTNAVAQRVVLQSFDGLGADDIDLLHPPSMMRIAESGTYAQRVTPVTPTVTSSTHTAILTGRTPEETGVLANYFHKPGTPAGTETKGFDVEIAVPTLVDAARNAGKRVGSICFPTLDARSPRRTPDFGLTWTEPLVAARVIHLGKNDWRSEWLPPGWGSAAPRHPSFSPVVRTRVTQGGDEFDLAAYDTTDDHVQNYDAFYVEHAGTDAPLDAQRWFAVATRCDGRLCGSWSKLVSFDPALSDATLYVGAVHRAEGVPDDFVRMVDDEVGFWPGKADEHKVDDATFAEQNHRLSEYLTRVTQLAVQRMPFDLLLAYQPIVDAAEHHLRRVNEPVIHAAIADADRATGVLLQALDPARDALIVTGDHGLAAVDTAVHVNTILAAHGFAPQWVAMTSGNIGMFSGGDAASAQTLAAFLTGLTTPDGAKVFEDVRVINGSDVRAIAFPRFFITNKKGDAFTEPDAHGEHGGMSTHHEYDTVLFAWGRGVVRETLPRIAQTDIAGYVARLLGMPAP
jgi:Type I phosphodiesterase / nucleotide pyrophosphatase